MRLLDKMIAGLECCREIDGCSKCPYRIEGDEFGCVDNLDVDILKYLKDQQNFIKWMEEERKG